MSNEFIKIKPIADYQEGQWIYATIDGTDNVQQEIAIKPHIIRKVLYADLPNGPLFATEIRSGNQSYYISETIDEVINKLNNVLPRNFRSGGNV